jgi:hypothetical protein
LASFTTELQLNVPLMVSLHKYYLSTILELECSIHLELVVNYVATCTINFFINCAIHWKCKCNPLVGLEWCIEMFMGMYI